MAAYNFDRSKSQSNASIFIFKLAVGLYFLILHFISTFHECTALFGAKMVNLCIIHIENIKIFSPPPLSSNLSFCTFPYFT